jgi:hypothetical protein
MSGRFPTSLPQQAVLIDAIKLLLESGGTTQLSDGSMIFLENISSEATIIAEAYAALTERDYRAVRCRAGIAPVTKQSGKQRMVLMRYACNGRLRHAFYHCARVAVYATCRAKVTTPRCAGVATLMAAPCALSLIGSCVS